LKRGRSHSFCADVVSAGMRKEDILASRDTWMVEMRSLWMEKHVDFNWHALKK
jgi:hypothetical protein